jgi:hypothetical protein
MAMVRLHVFPGHRTTRHCLTPTFRQQTCMYHAARDHTNTSSSPALLSPLGLAIDRLLSAIPLYDPPPSPIARPKKRRKTSPGSTAQPESSRASSTASRPAPAQPKASRQSNRSTRTAGTLAVGAAAREQGREAASSRAAPDPRGRTRLSPSFFA